MNRSGTYGRVDYCFVCPLIGMAVCERTVGCSRKRADVIVEIVMRDDDIISKPNFGYTIYSVIPVGADKSRSSNYFSINDFDIAYIHPLEHLAIATTG